MNTDLFDPARLGQRDEDGWVFHPDLDAFELDLGEESGYDYAKLEAQGWEHAVTDLYDDPAAQRAQGEYDEGHQLASWEPTLPAGDGWRLVCVCDTEDAPKALFVRPRQ